MNAIHVKTHLNSDTIQLPELKAFIGHDVEIIILDSGVTPVLNSEQKYSSTPEQKIAYWRSLGPVVLDEQAIEELDRISMI